MESLSWKAGCRIFSSERCGVSRQLGAVPPERGKEDCNMLRIHGSRGWGSGMEEETVKTFDDCRSPEDRRYLSPGCDTLPVLLHHQQWSCTRLCLLTPAAKRVSSNREQGEPLNQTLIPSHPFPAPLLLPCGWLCAEIHPSTAAGYPGQAGLHRPTLL